jgi:ribosomal protein L24E
MGVHLIKNDGTIDFYCSSKCRKNALNLGRDKRRVKWTQIYKTNLKAHLAKEAKKVAEEKKAVEHKTVKKK